MFNIEEKNPMIDKIKEYIKNQENEQYLKGASMNLGYLIIKDKIQVLEELQEEVIKTVYKYLLYGYKGIIKTIQ